MERELGLPFNRSTCWSDSSIVLSWIQGDPRSGGIVPPRRIRLTSSGQRILIFGSQQKVAILRESRTWYVDGTFQSAPPLFCKIYVILSEAPGGTHPVLYALLPDKSRSTYDRLFDMVKGIVPEANQEAFLVTLKWQPSMPNELLSQAFACMGVFNLALNMRRHLCT
ncbi:hypothetical protein T11_16897 [Trichinella zimbabwensis]|uniref:MULE transposase domain-containing protein n=1 Tax=Trichinella zimbabwensis TaxID=268475 RepID=A0A0V1HMG2_9BILA|nr:hypothetical protein T11_16897 [Trichinella zimbabwensis]